MTKCPHHQRHWFTYYGEVGVPSPVCVRCGAPNPRYVPDEETNPPDTPPRIALYFVGGEVTEDPPEM